MTPEARVKHTSAFSLVDQFSGFEPVSRDPLGLNGPLQRLHIREYAYYIFTIRFTKVAKS